MIECVKCGHENRERVAACKRCTWPFSHEAWKSTTYKIRNITVDTNCVNAKRVNMYLNTLEKWSSQGLLHIERSSVFLQELIGPADRMAAGKAIPEHPGLFTFGTSALGGGDVLAGPDIGTQIRQILFSKLPALTSNQQNDVEHLRQHVRTGRDIFVTLDTNDFIKKNKQVTLTQLGIWVFTPAEAVTHLKQLYGWP